MDVGAGGPCPRNAENEHLTASSSLGNEFDKPATLIGGAFAPGTFKRPEPTPSRALLLLPLVMHGSLTGTASQSLPPARRLKERLPSRDPDQ